VWPTAAAGAVRAKSSASGCSVNFSSSAGITSTGKTLARIARPENKRARDFGQRTLLLDSSGLAVAALSFSRSEKSLEIVTASR